ncbi:DinB family protein [uncultured Muriicola sp.]|uniref:DinB family protein n=1 Tax=uncultured Muriicola sp. TaxID=1583102 RepID=UPI00262B8D91|nr:DinB family protein [uncultured Muriicola sp.]
MEKLFDITEKIHYNFNKILTTTPKEHLFSIPENFNNNIFWNISHVLVTQQLLVYKLSKLHTRLDWGLVKKYSKGTFPDKHVTEKEVQQVAEALLATPGWTKEDYENGIFKEYDTYTTSANVVLANVEDAIAFNIFHLGLHMGTVQAIHKKLLASA